MPQICVSQKAGTINDQGPRETYRRVCVFIHISRPKAFRIAMRDSRHWLDNLLEEKVSTLVRALEVRAAFSKVLPGVTRLRRVGLITFGPGPYNQCNVQLNFAPTSNAGHEIMD